MKHELKYKTDTIQKFQPKNNSKYFVNNRIVSIKL